jgi:signal transduction histidine kinase
LSNFLRQNLKVFDKLSREQVQGVFEDAINEMDRLATVLDSFNLGIFVCSAMHKLLLKNKAADRLLLLKEHEQGADYVWKVIRDEAISQFLHDELKSGDKVEGRDIVFHISEQTQRILSFSVLPLVKEYKVTGSLIVVEDVTEKRAKESALRRIESLASLTTLAAGIAHEIKNPLASISIHTKLLQKELVKAKKKYEEKEQEPLANYENLERHISIVNDEIHTLNGIVVDFLLAVRPMNLTIIRSDINKLVLEMIKFLSLELDEAKIKCVVLLQKKLPLIEFDERYMKQALLNLIKNAKDAMSGGGTLTIRTALAENDVTISIDDTGCGISDSDKSKIFEPYFTTKQTGTGIGLTLVFKIVREHKGEITVKSKLGEGTSFVITLPIPQTDKRLLDYNGSMYEI